eukprot:363494-Chlamydomonas_euryale.AAC.5
MTAAVTRRPRRRRRQQQHDSRAAPQLPPLRLTRAVLLLVLGCCAHRAAGVGPRTRLRAPLTPVKVAFLTDCQMYSNWQSLAMIYSFKQSGQPGTLTRVMCCSEETAATYPKELLDEVETHIAPSYTVDAITHDNYAAYNKPGAVIDWLDHTMPEEEWVLVLDSDMILRRPFLVEIMQPQQGLAIGARYTYMIGVNNELAMRHVPEVLPRNDTLAGPSGRRGDQVGGFFFYQRDDLKRMSHNWLKYTEDVRQDPMVRAGFCGLAWEHTWEHGSMHGSMHASVSACMGVWEHACEQGSMCLSMGVCVGAWEHSCEQMRVHGSMGACVGAQEHALEH